MAVPNVVVDTTFTGKNISSAASVYEFTATLTGTYRFQVRLAAVAGNGDYVAYLTLNDGDALGDDPMLPKTTLAAASGETAFWFPTIDIDLIAGDVVNVFVDGLAGDTDEAGSIRIFSDAALQPTTAGRTLDVTTGGEAGLDFANINAASAPTTLTNITVPTVTTPTNAPGDSTGVTEILTRLPDATAGATGGVAIVGSAMTLAAGGLFVKKNTQLANFEFLMVLTSDHVTPATSLTVTATRSIDGAAFAACANAVSEVGSGVYKITLAAADLNGTTIMLKFSAALADTRFVEIITQL